jgi:beta-lactamase superfamily II metal-dependent hydrolase
MGDEKFPSWNNILATLNLENISTIDHMIITHNHSDHYYFVPDILSQYDVLNIYSSARFDIIHSTYTSCVRLKMWSFGPGC